MQPWSAEALPALMESADLIIRGRPALVTIDGEGTLEDRAPLTNLIVPADETVLTTPLLTHPRIRWQRLVDGVADTSCEITQDLADLSPGEDRVVRLEGCCRQPCVNNNQRWCCSRNQCVTALQCDGPNLAGAGCDGGCCDYVDPYYGTCLSCAAPREVFFDPINCPNCPNG